jgi:general secretion pathway protein A
MDYTTLLNLKKEPFSISPDPSFFYYSKDYQECLQKLELSIRLRRGLNIILGDVGTGKTTLSRALIQLFQGYEEFRFHLILDPSFNSEYEFLLTLIKIFNIPVPEEKTVLAFKEAIRTNLLREGLERKRIVVLIIDETQKMDYPFLELLRDFLNFETNEYKLLQLVLLGQMEFLEKIKGKNNFMDRVNMIYFLKPLNLADTREMIEFRLRKAGYFSKDPLFTKDAYRKIHSYSQGFPRKIVNLCHHCLLLMLIKKQRIVDRPLVEEVVKTLFPDVIFQRQSKNTLIRWGKLAGSLAAVAGIIILAFFGIFRERRSSIQDQAGNPKQVIQTPARKGAQSPTKNNIQSPVSSTSLPRASSSSQVSTSSEGSSGSEVEHKIDLFSPSSPIRKVGEGPSTYQQDSSDEAISRAKGGGYQVVAAGKGDFVSRMAFRLYGYEATSDILASIQKANPQISNLNLIEPGQKVYFPALDNSMNGKRSAYIYGVQVGHFLTVAEAQDCLRRLSSIGRRAYIEREDASDHGERYSVVIGPFAKITDAWDIIDELKKKIGTSISNNSRVMVINQD